MDLPENFMPPEAWPEFVHAAMPRTVCTREIVPPAGGPPGIRWGIWPLYFEEYVGDDEPTLASAHQGTLARPRTVMWKRVRRSDTPKGWATLSRRPWRTDGYITLSPGAEYIKQWYKQPRRDLRLWHEQYAGNGYAIEPLSLEEYCDAFAHSTVAQKIGLDGLNILERKWADPVGRQHMELWGVRNTHSGQVIAGLSIRYSPTYHSATYESPFILPEAKRVYAMTALMDHWFARAQAQGATLLVFNSFWRPGEPRSWKPFSLFKSHFNPTYTNYPPTLWKVVGGKIF